MVLWLLGEFLSLLLPLLIVAFFTLFQRKILGLTAVRLGVNKVSLAGILQPILDAVKLLYKKMVASETSMSLFVFLSPLSLFFFSLGFWGTFSLYNTSSALHGGVLLLFILGLLSFSLFGISWFSGSKYPSLGMMRSCVLSISLEACFGVALFGVLVSSTSLSFKISTFYIQAWILGFWLFLVLVDSMTSPFDLVEAESELVSGFNTEFGGVLFIFIFLSEYMVKIFFSFLTSYLFFQGSWLVVFLLFSFFILCQTTFLRLKSEWVMGFLWLKFLPLLIFLLLSGWSLYI